jgi:hypothetical protein
MSHKRFTIFELETLSNSAILLVLVRERQMDCHNVNSPLYNRLRAIEDWISDLPEGLNNGNFEIRKEDKGVH